MHPERLTKIISVLNNRVNPYSPDCKETNCCCEKVFELSSVIIDHLELVQNSNYAELTHCDIHKNSTTQGIREISPVTETNEQYQKWDGWQHGESIFLLQCVGMVFNCVQE